MEYTLHQLCDDVLALMGETRDEAADSDVLSVARILERKIAVSLPEIGARLIRDSPPELLGGAECLAGADTAVGQMESGLYALSIKLPEDFLRLVEVRLSGWRRAVHDVSVPGTPLFNCRWSREPAIAGCPEMPRAYLSAAGTGWRLTAAACASVSPEVESLLVWRIPRADSAGRFRFPSALYPVLVDMLAGVGGGTPPLHTDS